MQPAQQFAQLIIQINSQGLKRPRGGMGAFTARLAQHTANNLGQFARARNARGFTTRHKRPHNGARAAFFVVGFDLMVTHDLQVKVLELNVKPGSRTVSPPNESLLTITYLVSALSRAKQ